MNLDAKIGEWFDSHQGTNIVTDYDGVSPVGYNVWIAPGAKLYGNIFIDDNCAIGANAVVNKDFFEKEILIAGMPAKKIGDKGNQYIREWNIKCK